MNQLDHRPPGMTTGVSIKTGTCGTTTVWGGNVIPGWSAQGEGGPENIGGPLTAGFDTAGSVGT